MSPLLLHEPLGSSSPEGLSPALKALAQTLPILKVPDNGHERLEAPPEPMDSYQNWGGGIVSGDRNSELVTESPLTSSTLVVELYNTTSSWLDGLDNCTSWGNATSSNCTNQISNDTFGDPSGDVHDKNYWALLLLLFPVFTVFGNVLVLMSVYRERSLQTVTNYFIVSLAVADIFVASIVMPFNVYDMVRTDCCVSFE
ncbi:unnamed protein product, partial [Meganyctiphanes norvegica]